MPVSTTTSSSFGIMARCLSILILGHLVAGQTFTPSNSTLPNSMVSPHIQLNLMAGGAVTLSNQALFNIAPLTTQAGMGQDANSLTQLGFTGNIQIASASTASNLTAKQIAYVSCDPNDASNIDSTNAIIMAGNAKPKAIILYSQYSAECNLTGTSSYTTMYTMTSAQDSNALLTNIQNYPTGTDTSSLVASISPNQTSSSSSSSESDSNPGGPAPTTAVAMSILYSITGIITLLFLIIIATGAIRAHRHPERYGPRGGSLPGRPRQSRAKGLARAMLETLPIVKFGDPEPVKSENRDIELEDGSIHHDPAGVTSATDGATDDGPPIAMAAVGSGAALDTQTQREATPEVPQNSEDLGCSICTEDFTRGEDVRVLPCHHKYHPVCIDPWLLNVSGTCPLCRHDLRPTATHAENEDGELAPPLSEHEGEATTQSTAAPENGDNPSRHRVSRFLDLHRLRHAPPDERIAALRLLRQQTLHENAEDGGDDLVDRSRRATMTDRLRNTFRVRTRAAADPIAETETTERSTAT